jgi:hypothetical protein
MISPQHAQSDDARAWSAFAAEAAPTLAAFEESLTDPEGVQRELLRVILARNARTDYGRRYDFASIRSYADYRRRVPVTEWADVAPWVQRSQATLASVLSAETPCFYERTSGSCAASKLIPYTPSLLAELQRAVVVWLAQLQRACPAIAGPSYWALSPVAAPGGSAPNGIPIGSASDAQYLRGSAAERLWSTVLDTSAAVSEPTTWRLATLVKLIAATDLRMLSVWSPTFLTALFEPLLDERQRDRTLEALRGTLSAARREVLARALAAGNFTALWPALQVVSCWADGPSRQYAEQLGALFPQARLVSKGLFATEGVVSLPWGVSGRCPLAIESHVLEFVDAEGEVRAAHELSEGGHYRPLLTTSGGLYRYGLGDIVEVDGLLGRTPCIRYRGRSDSRCDLTGEKLDEALVAAALAGLPPEVSAAFVVPMPDAVPRGYLLLLESSSVVRAGQIAVDVEAQLSNVFHYRQARHTGQLAPLAVTIVANAASLLQRTWESLGRRAGDSKPASLIASLPHARALLRAIDCGPKRKGEQ